MIDDIKHKGLKQLFETGKSRYIDPSWHKRCHSIMTFLDAVAEPEECMGFRNFHQLKGDRKNDYGMSVTGNWRLTFEFAEEGIVILDLEDYHGD